MNFCKQCGKEIPEGRKFCNSSCAAKYNNAHRILKPRIKKVQSVVEKDRYCKCCGKKLESGQRSLCSECKPYIKVSGFATRLGFKKLDGQTLKEQYTLAIDYLAELYESGESTLTLEQKFGIPKETIWYNLKKFKSTRNLSEAVRMSLLQGRRPEGIEGNPRYVQGWHRNWQGYDGFYRSSYELAYAKKLDSQKISYRIEYIPTFTEYFDSQRNCKRIARPDFYLPETNEIVEIKSNYTFDEQEMKDKFKAYRERGFKPKLILEGKEMVL